MSAERDEGEPAGILPDVTAPSTTPPPSTPPSVVPRRTSRPPDQLAVHRNGRRRSEALVTHLLGCAPGEEHETIAELVPLGDAALEALSAAFPGPPWYDPRVHGQPPPPPHQRSAVMSAMASFGDAAVPHLASLLAHPRRPVQTHAALLAGGLMHRDLVHPLLVASLDDDPRLAAVAGESLARQLRVTGFDAAREELLRVSKAVGSSRLRRIRAVETLGALGDPRVVPELIALLPDRERDVARAAHDALVRLTGRDLGALRPPWHRWWESARAQDRRRWLVEGLGARKPALRRLCLRELERVIDRPLARPADDDEEGWATLQQDLSSLR